MSGILVNGNVLRKLGILVGVIIYCLFGLLRLEVIFVRNFIGVMLVEVVSCSLLKIVWWIFLVISVVDL